MHHCHISQSAHLLGTTGRITRLHWEEIHWGSKLIEVNAAKSKTARRRFIKMRPNLKNGCSHIEKITARFCPTGLRNLELETRHEPKFLSGRQCSATQFRLLHLAHFKNAAELALEMGHTKSADDFRPLSPVSATEGSREILENLSGRHHPG